MKKNARRFWMVTAICGGTALLFLALTVARDLGKKEFDPLQRFEFFTQDVRATHGIKTPVDPRLTLIGIDRTEYTDFFSEAELKANPTLRLMERPYPWSRAVWADLVTRLADAGAKVIVLDLLFGAQGEGEGDEALKQALAKYKDQVVIGCNLHLLKTDRGQNVTLDLPAGAVLNSSSLVSPGLDERVGYVNIWADGDDVLRLARYRLEADEAWDVVPAGSVLESLDARVLRKFGHPELIPAGSDSVRFRYTGWAGQGYPVTSLGDVMGSKTWKSNFKNGEFFRNKIVLIGPTAEIFQDFHKTPLPERQVIYQGVTRNYSSAMPGPEIHLNMIGAALNGRFLHDSPLRDDVLIIMLAGLVTTALSFLVHQPLKRLAVIILLSAGYWYWGQWLWDHADLVVPMASPLLVLQLSGVFVLAYDYFAEQFERTRVRKTMERYVSKNVVKELLDNPASYIHSQEGVRMPVTVLFSDIRGFTTLTESSNEKQLVSQLNEYFAEMTKHVFATNGTLDKFIGDAVMAVWGNILTKGLEKDARDAVATALAMKRSLAKLNIGWKERGFPELAIGIGINHGEAIAGNLGSTEKMDMTVIGNTVNTASRLESLTKIFQVDMLLGEAMAPLVRERFVLRSVGLIQPKGKLAPTEVFTVMGERGVDADANLAAWLAEYEAGVTLFRQRMFAEALAEFESCLQAWPGDALCKMYIKECEGLLKDAPDEKWNGVFVMTEK